MADLPEQLKQTEIVSDDAMTEPAGAPFVGTPERELAGEIHRAKGFDLAAQPYPAGPSDSPGVPNHQSIPAEQQKPLRRPIVNPAPERRKPAHLNVYVNQNAEWAARQFVPPQSPRAIFRHKTGHRCPKCGSQDTRLSLTRGIADCLMFLFDYSIARCRNCDSRFRIWRSREEENNDGQQELEAHPSPK